jgi:hypothetical protein
VPSADEAGNIYSALLLICRVLFSCCESVASPQATVWAPAWAPRPSTCDRRYCKQLHLTKGTSPRGLPCLCADKLVIFTLFLCLSADFFFLDAKASRRRKQKFWHLPGQNDEIHATHSERHRGKWPRNRDQVPEGVWGGGGGVVFVGIFRVKHDKNMSVHNEPHSTALSANKN